MAIVKLGGIVTEISGKIGGQSFSNYGSFATLKNITQRNTLPSSKQARQRFITGQISGSWAQLTQAQRDGWETASVNYTWYNKIGVQVTRNGFQTFNFLNQNLTLIGIAPNVNAPAYVPVTQPKINIIDISAGNFEIQSNNSSATYLYALFAAPNLPNGVSYAQNRMKYCGTITSAQLNAGYDVIADIEAVFGTLTFPNKISIIIDPINQTTGNRSQYVTEILNIDVPMIIEVTVADGNSITIPFATGGTFNGSIDWGDGTITAFVAWNSAGCTHAYTNGGVYRIIIFGTFARFTVNGGAFAGYLSNIFQFSNNSMLAFNLQSCLLLFGVSANNTPTFLSNLGAGSMLRNLPNLTSFGNLQWWDGSKWTSMLNFATGTNFPVSLENLRCPLVTNMSSAFDGSSGFGNLKNLGLGNVTTYLQTFRNSDADFDMSLWDFSFATQMNLFAFNCALLNTDLSAANISNVSTMVDAFNQCLLLNFELSGWVFKNNCDATRAFRKCAFTVTQWNNALIAWVALGTVPTGVKIGINATSTGAGLTAKNTLVATYGWTITEGLT
jgi:hypothetical protein